MAVTFVLGRAGVGKTRHCLDAVLAELGKPGEDRRLILLVPEQASFQMERALATRAPGRGYTRAAVLSFTQLARRVFSETGREPAVLDSSARALALRCVVTRLGDSLRVFRSATGGNGFFHQLDRLIGELLTEDVAPAALQAAAAGLEDAATRRKTAEIARIYAEYRAWLGSERVDPASRLAHLRQRLADLPWLRDASIWVDGFAGFTGQELATVTALAQTARDVTITLLLDPAAPVIDRPQQAPDPLGLFGTTEQTYCRLRALFAEAGVVTQPLVRLTSPTVGRFDRAAALARLEAGLATPVAEQAPSHASSQPGDVRVLACETQREELCQAARFIRLEMATAAGTLRWRDFAVIARDLEPFADTVAEVFGEYEIPYFLDRRRSMRTHPVSRFVQALFELLAGGFSVRSTTRLLRTGLLPLAREQAERLENIVVAEQVRGFTAWGRSSWDFGRDGAAEHGDAELDAARLKVVAALEPLVELARRPEPPTGGEWARTLHQVFETLGVRRCITAWCQAARDGQRWEAAELHRLAWEAFVGVLDEMHAMLDSTRITTSDLATIINTALAEQTLGMAPPTLDQVLVSSIERSRHPDIKHAWVIGFNEGLFPAPPPEDRLLSSDERDILAKTGLGALASHRESVFGERLLAYVAFTRPSQSLTISFARVGDDGNPLPPSPLLGELQRALPDINPRRPSADGSPACLPELAWGTLVANDGAGLASVRARYAELCQRVRRVADRAGLLDRLLRGTTYRNEVAPLGNFRRPPGAASDVIWNTSPSEIETYLQCPFKHFSQFGLRLDAQRGPQPIAWDLGSGAHEVLAEVTRRALAEADSVRDVAGEQWQTYLRDVLEEQRRAQPDDLAARQPQKVFLSDCLELLLSDVVAAHAARWRRGRFEPIWCERGFGGERPDESPGLKLALPDGGCVLVRGKIDRVDRCMHDGQTYLLVYDYKSSAAPIHSEYLTEKRLQLFLYLMAAGRLPGENPPPRLAGVFLAPLHGDVAVLGKKYAVGASASEQLMYMYRPRGLFEEDVGLLLDEKLGTSASPVAQMRLKKGGGFYATSDAKPAEEIERRLELARRTALFAAEGVRAGQVSVAPLLEGKTLACRNCDFAAVCRFDWAFNKPRVAGLTLPVLEAADAKGGRK